MITEIKGCDLPLEAKYERNYCFKKRRKNKKL